VDRKGKTTAAVGLAIRALGFGKRVAFLQFDKGYDGQHEHYNERQVMRRLDGLDLFPFGCERMTPGGMFRFQNEQRDLDQGRLALEKAREILSGDEYFVVVLDEILSARACKLVTLDEVVGLMRAFKERRSPWTDLVMTGRAATREMIDLADLVSEIQPVKHYFDQGVPAREGIEY